MEDRPPRSPQDDEARADVLWVLYAVCGCVLCMVYAECVLYCAIFTSKKNSENEKV